MSRHLVILVPALGGKPHAWFQLIARLKREPDLGGSDWYCWSHNCDILSFELATDLARSLSVEINQRWTGAGPYDSVILAGHGLGALLVREAYVTALEGKQTDGSWAHRVSRIILFAGLHQGWKPKYKRSISLATWILRCGGVLQKNLLLDEMRPGSAFVKHLNLRWKEHFAAPDTAIPAVFDVRVTADEVAGTEAELQGTRQIWITNASHQNLYRVPATGAETDQDSQYEKIRAAFCDQIAAEVSSTTHQADMQKPNLEPQSDGSAGQSESTKPVSKKSSKGGLFGFVRSCFQPPPEEPKATSGPTVVIGRDGEPLRALAFGGGGFDTAIQLGVTHALLVADAQPPDIVVGISAGAVNAVALAEILQAGTGLQPEQQAARVAKFREVLDGSADALEELRSNLFPDPYEVTARAPLKPTELPIHYQKERAERTRAVNARFGMIRLLNGLLGVRLQLKSATHIVRLVLELRRLGECQNLLKRIWLKCFELLRLWLLSGTKLLILAKPIFRIVLGVVVATPYQTLLKRLESPRRASKFVQGLMRLESGVRKSLLKLAGYYTDKTAKDIILRSTVVQWVLGCFAWLLGLICALVVWLIVLPVFALFWLVNSEITRKQPTRPKATARSLFSRLLHLFLASLDLQKDLATPYLLKPLLVRLFDPNYYGEFNLHKVVDQALLEASKGIEPSSGSGRAGKLLRHYFQPRERTGPSSQNNVESRKSPTDTIQSEPPPPIFVAPVAANASNGRLEALPADTSVVDALLAATATVPWFRAQIVKCDGQEQLYIDGLNIANEPTHPLFDLLLDLRRGKVAGATLWSEDAGLEVYPVSPFVLSAGKLKQDASADPTGLVGTARRAMELRRFQDANRERKSVCLYHQALPSGKTFVEIEGRPFARGTLHPIETDRMLRINERVLCASNREERRHIILEAAAEGCRATLQVVIAHSVQAAADNPPADAPSHQPFVSCRAVIRRRLGEVKLPGSSNKEKDGPGIEEVCRHCAVFRGLGNEKQATLLVQPQAARTPDWPKRDCHTEKPESHSGEFMQTGAEPSPVEPSEGWPLERKNMRGCERPTVTLLFSGGVFRGVFQVGVANALNETGLEPDLIAGSSVGAITGALIAKVFCAERAQRADKLRDLAAIFLGIDRLVLTDRFADFVRRFTLRSAETRFSLRDADQFFRRYDFEGFDTFNERSRRVIAGLERLFYLSPFELKDLTKAIRDRNPTEIGRLLRLHLQEFLDRSGVGQEILGAEPLLLLIERFVLSGLPDQVADAAELNLFQAAGIHLLVTATDLDSGELKILNSRPANPGERARLKEALLASSAFPAVFRPRRAWEVFVDASNDRFVDGGVMDNLPLDAVVNFLNRAARNGWVPRQPRLNEQHVPHLVFTASLEVRQRKMDARSLREFAESWPALRKRAKQLRYNQKIDSFSNAQRDLRLIREWRRRTEPGFDPDDSGKWPLLDIETVVVKPEWLPGTFAFHPMLGFRRVNQAASIAHGCASTFVELHRRAREQHHWTDAWGVEDRVDPKCIGPSESHFPVNHGHGKCWFRLNSPCPFSPSTLPGNMAKATRAALTAIYEQCGKRATHEPAA